MTPDPAQGNTGRPEIDADATEPDPAGDHTLPDDTEDGSDTKYRRRLREATEATTAAETERDRLRDRLEQLQRNEVVRLAGEERLARPEAIWATGVTVADLLDDVGQVDPAKVKEKVAAAVADLGLAMRSTMKPDPSQGARAGVAQTADNAWAQLLNRK